MYAYVHISSCVSQRREASVMYVQEDTGVRVYANTNIHISVHSFIYVQTTNESVHTPAKHRTRLLHSVQTRARERCCTHAGTHVHIL
jgi:hypothetical protein